MMQETVLVEEDVEEAATSNLVRGVDRTFKARNVTVRQGFPRVSVRDSTSRRKDLLPPVLLSFSRVATQSLS